MSYIGNTSTTQTYAAAIDYFSGNGSTTAFTLSKPVAATPQVQVVVNNVPQNPGSAFTVSGSTITFTSAPSSGSNNIYVYYTSPVTQVIAPSTGTVGKAQLDIANFNGTGAMLLPTGTTAQRPGSPIAGEVRYNSTTGYSEVYQNGTWSPFGVVNYSISALVVGGGGGGGGAQIPSNYEGGGGGGAGGYLTTTVSTVGSTVFTITVGAGGAGGVGGSRSTNGSNSVFSSSTAIGGGGGAGRYNNATDYAANSGGSGGGGQNYGSYQSGAAGTSGQGNSGGNASGTAGPNGGNAGGGGAGAVGGNGSGTTGGNGGVGIANTITGSSVYYAGGGGGGGGTAGTGGNGGGGNGASGGGVNGSNGSANTGGGGGGTVANTAVAQGGSGGSGVVILSLPTAFYSGITTGSPTITTSGLYTILTFTSSGSYTA